jgi:hypothetical protein
MPELDVDRDTVGGARRFLFGEIYPPVFLAISR